MDINFLEILYYITSIIASSGILYNFFKNFEVSIRYEIIFLNILQRRIYKLYFFIKYIIINILGISTLFVIGCTEKITYIIMIDFIIYMIVLCFYDFPYLFYQKIGKLVYYMKDKNLIIFFYTHMRLDKKKLIILFKIGISLIAAFFSYIFLKIFEYMFVFFQVSFLIYFFDKYIKKYNILKFKKFFKYSKNYNKDECIKVASPMFIFLLGTKLLIFYGNDVLLNYKINVSKFNMQNMKNFLYKIEIIFKNQELYIIIFLLIISIFLAYYSTYNEFNIKSLLWYENKSWEILHITVDNYALCVHDNLNMMIKLDTIKTDYYCIVINGTYQFYKK